MTLEGANKVLKRRSGGNELSRDMELLERLQRIRASLVAVREELKGNVDGELVASDVEEEVASVAQSVPTVAQPESGEQEVVSDEPIAQQENAPQPKSKRKSVVQKIAEDDAQEQEPSPQPKKRAVRRKKKDEEDKELFPFYEQSLF